MKSKVGGDAPKRQDLPSLHQAGMAFLKLHGKRFVFLFGGSVPKLPKSEHTKPEVRTPEDLTTEDSTPKGSTPPEDLEGKEDRTTSDLIAVDLEHFVWSYVDVEDGPVSSRTQLSLVGANDQLYIFGG